ncbi:MAG: hypothetical protein PHI99_07465 [Syntrophales bacterium]|nr:hypothetical protein [Syntrophales bacterium]HPL64047.1 hypothetical protein [Syntrophales bacterium]
MDRLKAILGYSCAVCALIAALATFLGNDALSRALASATGVTVSPWYSGGEVVRAINHGPYRTDIHRPVFDALIGERETGFVQVKWVPAAGLPEIIREKIEIDGKGKMDFAIRLDTKTGKADLESPGPAVISLENTYRLRDGWAARIELKRPS